MVDSIILGPGGCAALAYHDGERVRFAVAIEGENNIRAGVRYRLNEHISLLSADSFTFNQTKDADAHGMQVLRPPEPSPLQFLHMP